jgi:hypothetical protein
MKFCKFAPVVFASFFALVTACSITFGGNANEKASRSNASPTLTENDLANATYRIDELGAFQLDNGEFNRQYGEGMTQRHQVTLEKVAFGDLDHDGLSDAAVILARQSGGSGTFKYLVAMRNTGNAFRQQASVLLGDRVQINTMSIADDQVNLDTVVAGPRDSTCCPSQRVKQTYILRENKLVLSLTADGETEFTGMAARFPEVIGIRPKSSIAGSTNPLK